MQTLWGECAVADAHVHFFSRPFFESLAGQSAKTVEQIGGILGWELPAPDPTELAKRWASEMDAAGVARAE